jgi:hypothetical protein
LNYHDIPSSGDGSHETNYYVSAQEYDDQGRVKTSISTATATCHQVSQNVYDWVGRSIESKSGAGNSGLNTGASSTLGTLSLPTLSKLSSVVYDSDDVGDGLVTSSRSYYGSGTNDYLETIPHYTWRGQVRGSDRKNGTTSIGPWSLRDIDWKGKVTASATNTTEPPSAALFNRP